MKVSPISEYAHQLTRFHFFNCYLVQEKDGFTLIDTGFKGAGKQILEIAARLGSPIRRVASRMRTVIMWARSTNWLH